MNLLKNTLLTLVALAAGLVLAGLPSSYSTAAISQTSPVSVRMVWPTNGTALSGQITLTAEATSLVGPITRVEFYDVFATTNADGVVTIATNRLGVVTNRFPSPAGLTVY